jgi:hypothetical protein
MLGIPLAMSCDVIGVESQFPAMYNTAVTMTAVLRPPERSKVGE